MNQYLNFSLKGKVALVTGASYGIGFAIASAFAEQGATVCFNDINQELVDKGMAAYAAKGIKAHGYVCDVTKEDQVDAMVAQIEKEVGVIDILVNNAGIAGHSEPITETSNEDWNRIMEVNLNGPMYAIRAAVRKMLDQSNGGSIVTIASVAGIKGCRSSVAYSVAKHGLVGLCEHTAYAYMHQGIRSNIVCPGAIRTGMSSKPELESEFGRQRIMSGMDPQFVFGETGDIAEAVLFLAGDRAKFVNGATLVVDGGISCN